MILNHIYQGDCLKVLKTLPSKSVDCCITSPPYYGLRDYGMTEQIGQEETPEKFIRSLVKVFKEVGRVLKDDGTLWVNIGDSYASQAGGYDSTGSRGNNSCISKNTMAAVVSGKKRRIPTGFKPKDLIGIPWMLAFALRKSGWYLRQDIIWHKPNPMPESVTDRCTKSHEYIFLLSKSAKYYYDHKAIMQPLQTSSIERLSQDIDSQEGSSRVPGKSNGKTKAVGMYVGGNKHKNMVEKGLQVHTMHRTRNSNGQEWSNDTGLANKRSVWTVVTKPFKDAHFATFPQELILDCIKAGCPENGIVLDPFFGAGTTGLVARKLNRNYIGIELNPEYITIANNRLSSNLGLFK